MAMKSKETEYMYSSARIRALETKLAGRERMEHWVEAKSSAEILSSLGEYGFTLIREEGGELLREETLLSALENGFSEVSEMPNTERLLDFLRYPYDCHNIKSIIKCTARGVDAAEMLFSFGSISVPALWDAMKNQSYEGIPCEMAKAISEAKEGFAETGDPKRVDLILDRACFADMRRAAEETGVSLAVRLVETRIDLTNLLTCVRLLRMKSGARGRELLEEALLSGGTLRAEWLTSAYDRGEDGLIESLAWTAYSALADSMTPDTPLYALERLFDNRYLAVAREAKYVSFGAEIAMGYLVGIEWEVKNIRLLLAGKDAGLSSEVLRERMRDCYV